MQTKENNVLKLTTQKESINKQAIEYLTVLLEQAQEGRLTEFIMAYKLDGVYLHAWTGSGDLLPLSGRIARMQHIIQLRLDELEE